MRYYARVKRPAGALAGSQSSNDRGRFYYGGARNYLVRGTMSLSGSGARLDHE